MMHVHNNLQLFRKYSKITSALKAMLEGVANGKALFGEVNGVKKLRFQTILYLLIL